MFRKFIIHLIAPFLIIFVFLTVRGSSLERNYDGGRLTYTNKQPFVQIKYNGLEYPTKLRIPPPFPLWRPYPSYRLTPPAPPRQIWATQTWPKAAIPVASFTSTTTTTTTPRTIVSNNPKTISKSTLSPLLRDDEFPTELLAIAQNKLGLRSIDEVPSITELGELVGTNSSEETLKYIKQLTLTEQGVALLKAYIESSDYTDNKRESVNKNDIFESEEDEDDLSDIKEPLQANDEGLVVVTDEEMADNNDFNEEEEPSEETNHSMIERLADYVQLNNYINKAEDNQNELNQLNRITENGRKIANKKIKEIQSESVLTNDQEINNNSIKTPILVRDTIPYNYPIPIRNQIPSVTTLKLAPTFDASVVHLNTPKMIIPHVHQISRLTKIPSKQIEDFVASKPKLLDLVTKVSRLPIGYDRNSPLEDQVIAVVKKAFEEDDDLKKLFNSSATLN